MPIVRGAVAMLLAPGLNMYTFNKYRERPEEYRRYNNVQNSSRAYEEDTGWAGLGPLAPKTELETVILDEPINLGLQRFVHKTYALGIAYSREARDDDQYGFILQLAGQLGLSSRYTAELFGHDVLNNGFSAAKYAGRDGKALFATDHPVVGTGGTYANTPAVAADLSEAGLEAAIQSFENQINDRGLPVEAIPRFLVVSPDFRIIARRLLESELRPGTPNNDLNVFRTEGIQLVTSHYLTDKDAWFVFSAPAEVDTRFYWREMPDTKTWDDDNADATYHKIRQRHSVGFADWRNWYGNPGA